MIGFGSRIHLATTLAMALILATPGTPARAQKDPASQQAVSADSIKRHTTELADDKYEGRNAGLAGERRAGDYIAAEFKRIGLTPAGDAGRYFQDFSFHVMHPVKAWETLPSRNVLGRIDGSDPALRQEVVVIGAHYDGQGRTGQADPFRVPATPGQPADDIWNSANDNAVSVAAIIEIAGAIKRSGVAPKRTLLFVAFGAEEHGVAGSIHYIAQPTVALTSHVGMINLEKIGRLADKPLNTVGNATSPAWNEILKAAQGTMGAPVMTNPFAVPESDHYPFAAARIPVLMLIGSGAPDSHQPSDSADRIDFSRAAEAANFAMRATLVLANRDQRPVFAPSPMLDMGVSAHLATAAEADARGVTDPNSGLKVTGVIAGLPGAVAGLQTGDLIVEFAGQQFKRTDSVPMLMAMLREVLEGKRGVVLPIKLIRGKQTLELVMRLRSPQP